MTGPRRTGGTGAAGAPGAGGLALCCSGGGIRSASYNLGAMQALARDGTLERDVTLVSAVSGGSYTASSWLLLAAPGPDGEQVPLGEVYRPGSPEERHLRRSTRYLLPTAASALRGGLCVTFGLALNLSLLVGWLVAVLLPVGWWLRDRGVTRVEGGSVALDLGARGAAALPWAVPAALAGLTLVLFAVSGSGVSAVHSRRFHAGGAGVCPPAQGCSRVDEEQGWAARWLSCGGAQRAMAASAAAALGTAYVLLLVPWLVAVGSRAPGVPDAVSHTDVGAGLGSSFLALLATVRLVLGGLRGDRATAARTSAARTSAARLPVGVRRAVRHVLLPWTGSAVVVLLLVAASLLAVRAAVVTGPVGAQVSLWAGVVGYLLLARLLVDVNRTSLHSLYRDRLASAFAVRRAPGGAVRPAGQARLSGLGTPAGRPGTPELVVCATANVTAPGEVPAGRNGVSFTFTQRDAGLERPLSQRAARPGSDALYRRVPTEDYERVLGLRQFTLFDVVALSGAAVSPVMGASTRRPERLLLALANVRLGVWLPHPALLPVHTSRGVAAPDLRPRLPGAPRRVEPPLGTQPVAPEPADPVEGRVLRALTRRPARRLARLLAARLRIAEHEQALAELDAALATAVRVREAAPPGRHRREASAAVAGLRRRRRAAASRRGAGLGARLRNELGWRAQQPGVRLLLQEALGATSLASCWLYVTDGGHFDNLGLVEALRRGPDEVLVVDASADRAGTWATLGEAVGLARAELGIEVTLDPSVLRAADGTTAVPYVAGTYRSPSDPAGRPPHRVWLCTLGVPPDAPWDVRAFALTHPSFPTDSTLKQLYDGREFEAYRALGEHAVTGLLRARAAARARTAAVAPQPRAPARADGRGRHRTAPA